MRWMKVCLVPVAVTLISLRRTTGTRFSKAEFPDRMSRAFWVYGLSMV